MKLCSECSRQFDLSGWRCPFCLHEPERLDGLPAFAPELAEASEGFEADYFSSLVRLEAGNFWFRSRNRLLVWALQRYFPQAQNFMEIGCGTGFVLSGIKEAFPELSLFGSEVFTAGLCFAAGRLPGVELFQMDARDIPFEEEFDVIGAFDVLEHIKEDEEVLSQMYQATRKAGGILLTVPQHAFLWSQTDEYARHVRRYSARELKNKCERAGFSVVRISSFVSLLLPLLIISRAKQQLFGEKVEDASEFRISPLVNTTLEKALDVERIMIRSGLSFPAGGSLLLVARRN
ncbi:MAG TPA: methyltransferase domain-containing protein [Pyrinomonadaceae bacterium]|jgi:SAM-dependent methyltransferase|nr:methyltransferase domain-containing protein [Pyrinomonadaceae bacterium]